jgi:hypothetical protein
MPGESATTRALHLEPFPLASRLRHLSGNQQDVLIVLIRQTQRAQEDAKGTRVYIQNEAHKPQKPLQGLDRTPGQYWTEPLIDTMTLERPLFAGVSL